MNNGTITMGSVIDIVNGFINKNPIGTIILDGTISIQQNGTVIFSIFANNSKIFTNGTIGGSVLRQPLTYC